MDHRAVHEPLPDGLRAVRQVGPDGPPGPGPPPAAGPLVHRVPFAEAGRQVAPGAAGAGAVEDRLDEVAIVQRRGPWPWPGRPRSAAASGRRSGIGHVHGGGLLRDCGSSARRPIQPIGCGSSTRPGPGTAFRALRRPPRRTGYTGRQADVPGGGVVTTKGPCRSSPHRQRQMPWTKAFSDWGWWAAAASACSPSSNSRRSPGSGSSAWPPRTGPASLAAAARFGVENVDDLGEFLGRDGLDVVYIATPPFLHHAQAMAALEAGKHVIVEKPLALTVAEADELIAAARGRDRLVVANLMQRYNPLLRRRSPARRGPRAGRGPARYVRELRLGREPAGRALVLGPGQERRDLRGARGPLLRPLRGVARRRPARRRRSSGSGRGPTIEEQVQCTVCYGGEARVNFYHGFHQAGRMDRQELRLVFERGGLTLLDWVPTRARIHAVVDERQTRELCDLFPGAVIDVSSLLRREGPRLPGPRQGDRRLPGHRSVLLRGRSGEVAALRPIAPCP